VEIRFDPLKLTSKKNEKRTHIQGGRAKTCKLG